MDNSDLKKEIHLGIDTIIRGRYRVLKLIGRGGFCYTYKAFDSVLNVNVAIKEYFPHGLASRKSGNTVTVFTEADENMFYKGMKRFLNEARSLAQFNTNPNIVSIYDFFEENNTAYIVMEFLEGEDMKRHIGAAGNVLDFEYVKWLANSMCDTLSQVHEAGIVHRDISPDNIFICSNGSIKLIDFGAVKQSINLNNESVTIILKQGYAPKEQYSSKGRLGPWTDIYALGATLYRLISGRVPPDAIDRIDNDLLVPAHMLNPAVSVNFSLALMKAMSQNIEDRYQTMQEFKAALKDTNVYQDAYNNNANVFNANRANVNALNTKSDEVWVTKELIENSSIIQESHFEEIPEPEPEKPEVETMPPEQEKSQMKYDPVGKMEEPYRIDSIKNKENGSDEGMFIGTIILFVFIFVILLIIASLLKSEDWSADEKTTRSMTTTAAAAENSEITETETTVNNGSAEDINNDKIEIGFGKNEIFGFLEDQVAAIDFKSYTFKLPSYYELNEDISTDDRLYYYCYDYDAENLLLSIMVIDHIEDRNQLDDWFNDYVETMLDDYRKDAKMNSIDYEVINKSYITKKGGYCYTVNLSGNTQGMSKIQYESVILCDKNNDIYKIELMCNDRCLFNYYPDFDRLLESIEEK